MQAAVISHPELRLMGNPTFCFSFTSDQFNIYLLNDFMAGRGWRFNGQQHPNAIHMCVTRPQTQNGLVGKFAIDLADAVVDVRNAIKATAQSGAVYAGVRRESRDTDEGIQDIMIRYLESSLDLP
jgi:hypothetical protein